MVGCVWCAVLGAPMTGHNHAATALSPRRLINYSTRLHSEIKPHARVPAATTDSHARVPAATTDLTCEDACAVVVCDTDGTDNDGVLGVLAASVTEYWRKLGHS